MKASTYLKITLIGTILLLVGFAGYNIYVDPLFHFHGPTKGIEYPLWDERYMNDGIVRHFDYDTVMTGTSMTENFKPSYFDSYFGTNAIKVPFSGGTYKEVDTIIRQAFRHKKDLAYVVRSLDPTMLVMGKDELDYTDYPEYLYDNNPFNDVSYVLNKDIFFTFTEYVHTFMELGATSTDFDTYKNWAGLYEYNEDIIFSEHKRKTPEEKKVFSEEDKEKMLGNLQQNVVEMAIQHPETEFYILIPPYSICFFDDLYRRNQLSYTFDAWECAYEYLLQYDNINLFSFFTETEIITNLNFYKDSLHYGQDVSDMMIDSLAYDAGRITLDSLPMHMDFLRDYYGNFDYNTYFARCEEE